MSGTATTHYIHTDHLGTPRAMTDQAAAVVWDIETTPFGEVVTQTGTAASNLRFPGQYADGASGLSYNYYRDYDPSVGRYVQSDPLGLAGGLNTYAYAEGNTLKYSDYYGLATYMCTQPLHFLGGKGEKSGWDAAPYNPFYHQYLAVIHPDGRISTGGQDRSRGPWSPGQKSQGDGEDYQNSQCDLIEDDNACMDSCVQDKIDGPRPYYGLVGPGTNCQEWANDAVNFCKSKCGS